MKQQAYLVLRHELIVVMLAVFLFATRHAVAAGSSAQAAPASDEQAALQADRAFVKSVATSDPASMAKLVDQEFTWTTAEGKTLTRAQVLAGIPKPGIRGEATAQLVSRKYDVVEMIQVHSGRANIMRLWVQRPAGWRLLIYQEAQLMQGPSSASSGTNAACENPCKSMPYTAKNQNERDVLAGYMALQTATAAHDSANWGRYVADEFSAASSNSNQLLTRQGRMADLDRSKMAGYSPMPVVTMKLFDFGNTFVLVSQHQPPNAKAMHMTRLWNKRDGHWMEVASYQTRIE